MKKDKNTLNKEFGERLEEWIKPIWDSQKVFSEFMAETVDPSIAKYSTATINSYCKGRTFPDQVFLYTIRELGADLNALISGVSLEPKSHVSSLPHVERLKLWIAKYCGTFPELFSTHKVLIEKMQLDSADIYAFIYGTVSYAPKVSNFFKAIGCNMHWVATGEGSELISSVPKTQDGEQSVESPVPGSNLSEEAVVNAAIEKMLADPELSDKLSKRILEELISNLSKRDK